MSPRGRAKLNHEKSGRQTKHLINSLSPFKMIAKLEWAQSNAQQNIEQLQDPTMGATTNNNRTSALERDSSLSHGGCETSTSFVDHLCYLCLVFVMLSSLFIAALRSPEGKGLTSWLLFGLFIVILLLCHLVSWDRCGTWLSRFLILAVFLISMHFTCTKSSP